MGIFDIFKSSGSQAKKLETFNYSGTSITSIFGGDTGITEEKAVQVPAVNSSINLIAGSIAQLPIYLYKEDPITGDIEKVNDYRNFLLNNEPNETVDGFTFKRALVKDLLLYGASYTKVDRTFNEIDSLWLLPTKEVTVNKYLAEGYKRYSTIALNNSAGAYEFDTNDIVSVLKNSSDGITSSGILKENAATLRLALEETIYSENVLKNGAMPLGVLKTSDKLTKDVITRLRASWENIYVGSGKAGKTVILESGMEYQALSLKPDELQLTESRKATLSEVARIFNLPESMLNASANKYASNEQNNLYFLQYCISPLTVSIETSLDKALLLESEKEEGYFFRFDTAELLRSTEKERVEAVAASFKAGISTLGESRAKLDLPKVERDFFAWSLGNVFYDPEKDQFIVPNMDGGSDTVKANAVDANSEAVKTASKDLKGDT